MKVKEIYPVNQTFLKPFQIKTQSQEKEIDMGTFKFLNFLNAKLLGMVFTSGERELTVFP